LVSRKAPFLIYESYPSLFRNTICTAPKSYQIKYANGKYKTIGMEVLGYLMFLAYLGSEVPKIFHNHLPKIIYRIHFYILKHEKRKKEKRGH